MPFAGGGPLVVANTTAAMNRSAVHAFSRMQITEAIGGKEPALKRPHTAPMLLARIRWQNFSIGQSE